MKNEDQLIEAWVGMWNSYDLCEVNKLFIADSHLTYFSSEKPGVLRGIDAVCEHHRGFGFVEGGKTTENRLWLEDIGIDKFGEIAVVTAIWLFQRPSGQIQRGPVTFVSVCHDNECRFVHLNFANDARPK